MPLTFEDAAPRPYLAIFLYGAEGSGKSTAAALAPDPVLYLNADRPGGIRYARLRKPDHDIREMRVSGRKTIEDAFLHAREGDEIRTVVLDSIDAIYTKVLDDLAKDRNHPTLPERGEANTFIARYVEAFLELPLNVVLVAHDLQVTVAGSEEQGETVETMPFCGTNKPSLTKLLTRPMDVLGFCGRIPPVEEGDEARYVAQLVPAGGRHAKNNTGLDLGDFADLDLTRWIELNEAACLVDSKE